MSRWYDSIDRGPGRTPVIRAEEHTITFELGIVGGVMRDGKQFVSTPRTRVVIRCHRAGEITIKILEGRSSGV